MAKAAQQTRGRAPEPEPRKGPQAVAMRSDQVPANRAAKMAADAGKGISKDQTDKLVPMIRVLQSQSPQCLRQKPEYVKGAEAGDIYVKNMPQPLVKAVDGIQVVPCAFSKCWLQFRDRDSGGGFVARFANEPGDRPPTHLKVYPDEENPNNYRVEGTGKPDDQLIFCREHYVLMGGKPFYLPMTGSGHTTSREWQTLMDQFTLEDGRPEPSFNRRYHLRTVPKTNNKGDWFGWQIEEAGEVDDDTYDRARALHEAVSRGERVADSSEMASDANASRTPGNAANI